MNIGVAARISRIGSLVDDAFPGILGVKLMAAGNFQKKITNTLALLIGIGYSANSANSRNSGNRRFFMNVARLSARIIEAIKKDGIRGDSPIPSLRELARRFNVSPSLARKSVMQLQDEGVVVSIHGKGTFLAESAGNHKRKRRRMFGLGIVDDLDFIKELTYEWLKKDWLLAVYNASRDSQDPRRERAFLEKAEREGFAGVALMPTPLEPTNSDLYAKLRCHGMKVALLAPVSLEMQTDCSFFLDHHHAGYLSVVQLALRGYRNVLYTYLPAEQLFTFQHRDGIRQASDELGISRQGEIKLIKWEAKADTCERKIQIHADNNADLVDLFRKLPCNTAIISSQEDEAEVVRLLLFRAGRNIPDDIGICTAFGALKNEFRISRMSFPYHEQIDEALKYIADEDTKATDKINRRFPPRFIEEPSTRSLTGNGS